MSQLSYQMIVDFGPRSVPVVYRLYNRDYALYLIFLLGDMIAQISLEKIIVLKIWAYQTLRTGIDLICEA